MMGNLIQLFNDFRGLTASLGFWWPLVLVPIWQELLFRYVPYRLFYLTGGNFWLVGIISNIFFASIHWYFGRWFVLYAFVLGMVAWLVMIRGGLLMVIILHFLSNILVWYLGFSRVLLR